MIEREIERWIVIIYGFRLLNSEIGNDLSMKKLFQNRIKGFRLLNSEIGNDPTVVCASLKRA